MSTTELPAHISPPYSDEARRDALFHYTTATGLIGILETGQLWSTAYFCANDESELSTGTGILRPLFSNATHKMIEEKNPLVRIFALRGVDILHYADTFEQLITSFTLSDLCAYITCFCKANGPEDFKHGLLSQWRAYGPDGGYALQFSRKKLMEEIERANTVSGLGYGLQDVNYTTDNDLKAKVLSHEQSFLRVYSEHLEELGAPDYLTQSKMKHPVAGLVGGPIESFLDYLIHTKNPHFSEENECRLSTIDVPSSEAILPINYFNRNGLVVPYKQTPKETFDVRRCVEWIIIGPAPRMKARFKSVIQMIHHLGLNISVRPSHIPFFRT